MRYHYKCNTCNRILEIDMKITDNKPDLLICPCHGTARRIYEMPAIKYKGEGFYTNDQWHPVDEDPADLK